MKYVLSYSEYNIREGNEAGFLQRDPMKGFQQIYQDIESKLGNKLHKLDELLKKATKSQLSKLKDFIPSLSANRELNESDIKRVMDVLSDPKSTPEEKEKHNKELKDLLDSIRNGYRYTGFKQDEENAVKLLYWLSKSGLTISSAVTTLGIPLVWALGPIMDLDAKMGKEIINALYYMSIALVFVAVRVMEIFGYDLAKSDFDIFKFNKDTFFDDEKVTYDDELDTRNKNK